MQEGKWRDSADNAYHVFVVAVGAVLELRRFVVRSLEVEEGARPRRGGGGESGVKASMLLLAPFARRSLHQGQLHHRRSHHENVTFSPEKWEALSLTSE